MVPSIPIDIQDAIQKLLEEEFLNAVTLEHFSFVGGGCINTGGQLKTSVGEFFVKWNDALKFPGMFETEAKGLKYISSVKAINTPKVIGNAEANGYQFILLEFIEPTSRSKKFWTQLGEQLGELHKNSHDKFGLDHDNYIGSLNQFNESKDTWIEFFIEQRLQVQIKLAVDTGLADNMWGNKIERLFPILPTLFPDEKPALLHGDLWSGNLIVNNLGAPCLIDPAVYYGNREAELAFTKLFGGFDQEFYNVYKEVFPLTPKFKDREDIYNLYPLLVHANLFGRHYLNQVNHILNSLIK